MMAKDMARTILLLILFLVAFESAVALTPSDSSSKSGKKKYMIMVQNIVADRVKIKRVCVSYRLKTSNIKRRITDCQQVTAKNPGYTFLEDDNINNIARIAVFGKTVNGNITAVCLPYSADAQLSEGQQPVQLQAKTNYVVTVTYIIYDDMVCNFMPIQPVNGRALGEPQSYMSPALIPMKRKSQKITQQ